MRAVSGGGFGLGSSELMIPDAVQSLKAMPERLAARSRKFYDVTPATTIKNNWIHNSGGAGIYFNGQVGVPLVRNNTIYDNSTYGIEATDADPNIVNCIIYGNGTGDLYRPSGTFDVNYCCLQSVHGGQGNIVADPFFINPTDPNDLHISEDSPCKDAGDPNVDYGDETDIDGEARVKYGRVDIGADEYYWSPADLNRDEIVNFLDYGIFALAWATASGEPNYNEDCDLADNNSIDYNDLDLFCEDWLWEAGWGDTQWMMCMGGGGFGPGRLDISELMIPDAVQSLKAMPERLAARSRKFYDVTPATTIAARQAAFEVDIEKILEWLDGFWLEYEELREAISEDEWEKFIEAIEESLKQN